LSHVLNVFREIHIRGNDIVFAILSVAVVTPPFAGDFERRFSVCHPTSQNVQL